MTEFSAQYFQRMDEDDDSLFYQQARKVVHIDDGAIAAVSRLFQEMVPADSVILDLMSSWRSHWPEGHPKARMVGLGMNREEMEDNPDLDEVVVYDLNRNVELPFEDDTFDAVLITVSAQYLVHPVETFRESEPHPQAIRAIHRQFLQPHVRHQGRLHLARLHRPGPGGLGRHLHGRGGQL